MSREELAGLLGRLLKADGTSASYIFEPLICMCEGKSFDPVKVLKLPFCLSPPWVMSSVLGSAGIPGKEG